MHLAGILLFQLFLLYLLSRQLQRLLSQFFYQLLHRDAWVMWMMALLFLPGTFIHELSHWTVARLLLVRAGKLTVIPRSAADGTIRMGSVEIAKPDPLRRFIIGVAPVFVGIGLLLLIMWWQQRFEVLTGWIELLVVGYAVFQIANCLFASRKDMEGSLFLLGLIGLVVGIAYWIGWRPSIEWVEGFLTSHQALLAQAIQWLWIPIAIDAGVIILLYPLTKMMQR